MFIFTFLCKVYMKKNCLVWLCENKQLKYSKLEIYNKLDDVRGVLSFISITFVNFYTIFRFKTVYSQTNKINLKKPTRTHTSISTKCISFTPTCKNIYVIRLNISFQVSYIKLLELLSVALSAITTLFA